MKLYQDENRSFEERAAAWTAEMTLDEKITQVGNNCSAIPRLGLPGYDYWSEASHGFFGPIETREMDVTSYPVCLAMSQSWDPLKIKEVTALISDECRAHHNLEKSELHMWCPTINLARDPRNGRSDENFGEDPFLAGKLATGYIQGMQGENGKYLKTVSTPKHYAMNSSENNRHFGSSNADEATIREYYAKVFEYAIKEGKAKSIMTSYSRINGVPSSVNDFLLTTLLREEWGFDGFVVSDCCAVADCYRNPNYISMTDLAHYYCKSLEEASAMSLKAGTDVSCGVEHKKALKKAVEKGMISEDVIDRAIIRSLTSRLRLGLFDAPEKVPYNRLGKESVASEEMARMSVSMARESIVLLRNRRNLLPVRKEVKKILVVGPNAIYRQLGGYSAGQCAWVDTVVNIMALDAIRSEAEKRGIEVSYEKGWCTKGEFGGGGLLEFLPGFDPAEMMMDVNPAAGLEEGDGPEIDLFAPQGEHRHIPKDPDYRGNDEELFARALKAAGQADMVIVIAGTDENTASEEHDRDTLALPYGQDEKICRLLETNDNTAVVLTTLGPVTGKFFERAHTIVNAHFCGQAQGTAIADVLFGNVNPQGKLTATWYKNENDLPHINDYGLKPQDTCNQKARTYMYFNGDVLFPFGYGLSYTTYRYSNLKMQKQNYDANETIHLSVDVENTGKTAGAEIVQIYVLKVLDKKFWDNKPIRQLKGFSKVWLEPGEKKTVEIAVPLPDVTFWSNMNKRMVVEPGTYRIEAGPNSAQAACSSEITVSGTWDAKLYNVYTVAEKYIYEINDTGNIHVSATLEDAAHLTPEEYQPEFASSDNEVASVDASGVIRAVSEGTARITTRVTYRGVTKESVLAVAVKRRKT